MKGYSQLDSAKGRSTTDVPGRIRFTAGVMAELPPITEFEDVIEVTKFEFVLLNDPAIQRLQRDSTITTRWRDVGGKRGQVRRSKKNSSEKWCQNDMGMPCQAAPLCCLQ